MQLQRLTSRRAIVRELRYIHICVKAILNLKKTSYNKCASKLRGKENTAELKRQDSSSAGSNYLKNTTDVNDNNCGGEDEYSSNEMSSCIVDVS